MDWPLNYHSKGRPRGNLPQWTLVFLALISVFLEPLVAADASPPVADVEDLFKDEGFLRMSRGGEAFGRKPPPPPLILGPPHFSTQPPRVFPTLPPKPKPSLPPRNELDSVTPAGSDPEGSKPPESKPLPKDVNAVFSKVSGAGIQEPNGSDSDAHPLLGITPAAPGEVFDFNPILSNPAVTRILAGSSGRIPQWEPTLPDLHDLLPEVNYTVDPATQQRGQHHSSNSFNPPPKVTTTPPQMLPHYPPSHSPRPVFVPSPVSSSKSSPTLYNMDQLTNNIAIPKHVLPNPSNLATSRSTIMDERGDKPGEGGQGGLVGGEERDSHHHFGYAPNSSPGSNNNHLDEGRGESPYAYEDEEAAGGGNEESKSLSEAQGKRVTWKGEEGNENREGNGGPRYIVCDALCGAWKHQCKLMGILFSITSVLCLVFALVVLHSLHFNLRDFAPFSVILLFLFTASASRASILLAGWFCSPESESRPSWLPIISILPATFFVVAFLVALHLAKFPFPFIKSYNTIPAYVIFIISLGTVLLPLALALGSYLHHPSQLAFAQGAWIAAHMMLILVSLVYIFKFRAFYAKLSNQRGSVPNGNGGNHGMGQLGINGGSCAPTNTCTLPSLKNRGFVVRWGCLQARAMFGAALLALTLSIMIIISVSMSRGECEKSSTWTGWVLSLCARMLEFAVVILLLVVTIFSVDIRFISRLTRVSINKSNVGLMNGDIYPTMVSSNAAVQRCIPMYSSNARADVMMLGATESRSSLRGKTFGERALPGERLGEYRSSMGRGLPLRLGNGPSHSLPVTPVDGFPQGLKLPEPAPASLLVTKVVFGKPVSREVNHSHQHENPLLCSGNLKEDSSNIYASLESVKIAPFPNNAESSNGSNHSGSNLLSAPRDYIYSISRDLTKTIDSIYDSSRPRGTNLAHTIDNMCPPLAHTIEQIGSIPNLSGSHNGRGGHLNYHTHGMHHQHHNVGVGAMTPGRTDLARTIERIRYAAAGAPPPHPGPNNPRNFVLQLSNPNNMGSNHNPGMGNPPPYCSSESSHDVTPDSGIVADIHSKSRMDGSESVYSRDYNKRNSVEDVRRLPALPLQKHRTPGQTPLCDRTPTSPAHSGSGGGNPPQGQMVGRVEHLLNQTEHILSRTESLDSNSHSAGLQRLLSHKEQLEHVERLLAQAEYAIWLEKRTTQVSQLGGDPLGSPYGYSSQPHPGFSTIPNNLVQCKDSEILSNSSNIGNSNNSSSGNPSSMVVTNKQKDNLKKISKTLEEESVV